MNSDFSISRRRALTLSLAVGATAAIPRAFAQAAGPTRIVIGVPPGGGLDTTARLLADQLTVTIGTTLVDNRPGAALRLALDFVKQAQPDGKVLLYGPEAPLNLYPHVYRALSYDWRRDFVPVASACLFDFALGVPASSPASTIAQYIDAVKSDPARLGNYAVPGAGTAPHFAGGAFSAAARLDLKAIPYKGSAPAVQDLIGGHVPACFTVTGEFLPHRQAGKLKVLATTGRTRSPFLPDVPTFTELGFADMALEETFGFFAPARTPEPIVNQLNALVNAALQKPEITRRLAALGYQPFALTPQTFAARLESGYAKWAPLVKRTGFTPDE